MHGIDVTHIETPAFVIDLGALEDNLRILGQVQEEAGCKILLALKGYAAFSTFGLVKKYLAGATSSPPHEAQLAREELGLEVHAYAPAYSNADMTEILRFAEHVVVNSPAQLRQHGDRVQLLDQQARAAEQKRQRAQQLQQEQVGPAQPTQPIQCEAPQFRQRRHHVGVPVSKSVS